MPFGKIFGYFFGIIFLLILVYVLIVVFRTILSYGSSTFVATVNDEQAKNYLATTTETLATGVKNFTLGTLLQRFEPNNYRPGYVVLNNNEENTQYQTPGFNGSSVLLGILQRGGTSEDFDRRWGGMGYAQANYLLENEDGIITNRKSNIEGNHAADITAEYIKPNLVENNSIKKYQTIDGYAYYKVFSNRYFYVYIVDENGLILGRVKAFMNGNPTPLGYVPFRAVLQYENSATRAGYLIFEAAPNEDSKKIVKTRTKIFFRDDTYRMPPLLFSSP